MSRLANAFLARSLISSTNLCLDSGSVGVWPRTSWWALPNGEPPMPLIVVSFVHSRATLSQALMLHVEEVCCSFVAYTQA